MVDFFGCAGLGADGYAEHFDVVVVDTDGAALRHAAKAGHEVVKGDALALLRDRGFMRSFVFAHTSPPCQGHSATRQLAIAQGKGVGRSVDLIPATLDALRLLDIPWVIENVNRSPVRRMPGAVRLCGSSFGLRVERHRWFAPSPGLVLTGTVCDHGGAFDRDPITGKPRPWGVYGSKSDNIPSGGRTVTSAAMGHEVMGINHRAVPWKYLCEGLPPAFTAHLGQQVVDHVRAAV
jgi:hypothetical protein